MGGKKKADEANNEIGPDEFAVKLTRDIEGGLGNHSEGTVLRHLSQSAFTTLTQGGYGEKLEPGASATEAVDASVAPSLSEEPPAE